MLLTALDRDRLWVIGHTGRRWETIGPIDELLDPETGQLRSQGSARDGVPSIPADAAARPATTPRD